MPTKWAFRVAKAYLRVRFGEGRVRSGGDCLSFAARSEAIAERYRIHLADVIRYLDEAEADVQSRFRSYVQVDTFKGELI